MFLDDFIVTDEGRHARQRQRRYHMADVPEQAMEDAREIFGVDDFNFDEFFDEDLEVNTTYCPTNISLDKHLFID